MQNDRHKLLFEKKTIKVIKAITFSHIEHTPILLCVHKCEHTICIFNKWNLSKNGNCLYKVGKREK